MGKGEKTTMAEVETAPAVKALVHKYPVNGARGEVRLVIADVELVIAATLGGLSAVSSRVQCKSLNDLFIRLSGVEVEATVAAIELLTVPEKGDWQAAIGKLNLRHFASVKDAFLAALSHHLDGGEGNAPAAARAA